MILNIHSHAYYLSEHEAKSRADGFFYLRSSIAIKNKLTNGSILIIIKILKHIMSSEAEAEIGSVFLNAKEATILRTTLEEEMGHSQPPTQLQTDNTTAMGNSNDTTKHRYTRAMDMRFYWVPGFQNVADYFTKHNLSTHHKIMQEMYISASA
jgi:hypothetical protein